MLKAKNLNILLLLNLFVMSSKIYSNKPKKIKQKTSLVKQESKKKGNLSTNEYINIIIFAKGSEKVLRKVEVSYGETSLYTNSKGEAKLSPPPKKEEIVRFYRSGYIELKLKGRDLILTQEDDKVLNKKEIFLEPGAPSDNVVIIRGKKKQQEISRKTISITEAKAVAPRGDAAQIPKLLPGVQTPGFRPDVVVRGSAPDDSRYYVDSFDVPFIYHSVGGISILPEQLLSNVKFSAGGFGPQYGDATGGVIVLETKDEIPERSKLDVTVNLPLYSGIFYETPLDEESSISIAARRSYIDQILRKVFKDDMLVVPIFGDAHLQYTKRLSDGTVKGLFLNSLDRLTLAVPGQSATEEGELTFDISTQFSLLGFEWNKRINKEWSFTASPQTVYVTVDNNFSTQYVNIRGPSFRLPIEFQKRYSRKEKLYIGFEEELAQVNVKVKAARFVSDDPFIDFEEAPEITSESFYSESLHAAWVGKDFLFGNFIFTPTLRAFYATQIEKYGFDPRFQLTWNLNEKEKFKFAIGKYSKNPDARETDKEYGNTDLTFTQSTHYIAGWEKNWSQKWSNDIQAYYKLTNDVVRSNSVFRYLNSGQLRSYGAEVFIRRNETEKAFGWLSYTYSKTEERKTRSDSWGPAQYDQTHIINLVANYKFSGKWSLGGRINYHTGDRFTPVDYAVFNSNYGKYQPRYSNDKRYGARLPDYYQIDLYNVYDFLFDKWKIKLRSGVEYLAFSRPAFGVSYNYDYSEKEYFRGLPPIPYIEVQGQL